VSGDAFQQRLAERASAARVVVTGEQRRQLETYFVLLKRWSARMNLTALPLEGLPDHTIDRLFIEPLAAARYVSTSPLTWVDVGSGGGSPAIPLKLLRPQAKLTMVESKARKAAFLREAIRTLGLLGADVKSVRFEELSSRQAFANMITLRAVRIDGAILSACRSVLQPGGELLLFQTALEPQFDVTGFRRSKAIQLTQAPAHLVILKAV
jgi:16S rRNA (guanine527-N7)-methyltransferase